jgi:hypothetical protein
MSELGITKIFLARRGASFYNKYVVYKNNLLNDRTNKEFIELVEKCNSLGKEKFDMNPYCSKWRIEEIPTPYFVNNFYEIKNKWTDDVEITGFHGFMDTEQSDEQLILHHEKYKLFAMDPSEKQRIVLQHNIIYKKYSIINIYELFLLEKGTDVELLNETSEIDIRTNNEFIEWVQCIQPSTHTLSEKSRMLEREFEISEIEIKILKSECFVIQTGTNGLESVIILEDKHKLYKYINVGLKILEDSSINSDKKVELIKEFMSGIIEQPSTIYDTLKDRSDFFPGYGDEYIKYAENWKRKLSEI